MLIKVKTLTGKEIEIDIEPNDKVERIKERVEEKVIQSNDYRLVGQIPPQCRAVFLNGLVRGTFFWVAKKTELIL